MSDEHGRKIAEAILQGQMTNMNLQVALPQSGGYIDFVEPPRAAAYYYRPHQMKTVEDNGGQSILYDFSLPSNKVFHIHRIANNWFEATYSIWKVDGVSLEERIERFIADINSPLNIKDRYLVAKNNVKWITVNNSNQSILSEVLIDGIIYHAEDWSKVVGRF